MCCSNHGKADYLMFTLCTLFEDDASHTSVILFPIQYQIFAGCINSCIRKTKHVHIYRPAYLTARAYKFMQQIHYIFMWYFSSVCNVAEFGNCLLFIAQRYNK